WGAGLGPDMLIGVELLRGLPGGLNIELVRVPSPELVRSSFAVRFVSNAEGLCATIRHAEHEFGADGVEPILLRQRELVACDPRVAQSLLPILLRSSALTHDAPRMSI